MERSDSVTATQPTATQTNGDVNGIINGNGNGNGNGVHITQTTSFTTDSDGHVQSISICFINDLLTLLSILSDTFEEPLALLSCHQQEADLEVEDAPLHQQMLVVFDQFEDDLRDAMGQLKKEEETQFTGLVRKYPGTEALAEPRRERDYILNGNVIHRD